jgi:hypothetical protein
MRFLPIAAVAVLAIGGAPVQAAPTYLTCTVAREGEGNNPPVTIEFTLNEEAQTASRYIPSTGFTSRLGATFQRDVITMREVSAGSTGPGDGSTFTLDRTNGHIVQMISLFGGQLTQRVSGTCVKSAPPANRAF